MERVKVSVVMPCYNEAEFIKAAIESLMSDYCRKFCEILVVDGMSDDGTRERIEELIKKGYPVKLIDNQYKYQAYGLNLGIKKAEGDIIVRADAHCVYPFDYVKKCVQLLEKSGADNVGGVMAPCGKNLKQEAMGMALSHPLGAGNAAWHLGTKKGYVDTVYLGTFRKKLFDDIGYYDTRCRTNEDAELNLRILKSGGKIFLDNSIRVIYYPRDNFKELALQYFRYGIGRAYTTLKHKKITSWRQLAPVVLILSLFSSMILSFWEPLFFLFPLGYAVVLIITALLSWRKKGSEVEGEDEKKPIFKQRFWIATCWVIMHVCWGFGFFSYLFFRGKPEKEVKDNG